MVEIPGLAAIITFTAPDTTNQYIITPSTYLQNHIMRCFLLYSCHPNNPLIVRSIAQDPIWVPMGLLVECSVDAHGNECSSDGGNSEPARAHLVL